MNLRANILEPILRLVFPRVCEICHEREAAPADSYICRHCREHPRAIKKVLPPICKICGLWYECEITNHFACRNCFDLELEFASARSATQYAGLVKEIIHRFKYGRNEWFEPFLSDLLVEAALPELRFEPVDLIIPIPLHARKRRGRGFNQAERLAARLSEAARIPHNANLVERVRDTNSQAGLDRDDRIENVKGAFKYVGKERLNGERMLLIDDVLTTGLTASACAKELRKNGAGDVRVWTVARGGLT